jgi:hypothetical protein
LKKMHCIMKVLGLTLGASLYIAGIAAAAPVDLKQAKVDTSFVCQWDTIAAINDGIEAKNSADQSIPRFTLWDHLGTEEWVEILFPADVTVSELEAYWFDDEAVGGRCRTPEYWELQYLDGSAWKPVKASSDYGVEKDMYNKVTFGKVTTKGLRMELQLQDGFSGGILEVKAGF